MAKQKKPEIKSIAIRKARANNLKEVSIDIPRNRFTVVTGVSGSGKSSLAFDTLYAEGQRRFVESLSAYARQFLDRISKPDVESITGLPPAVAIGQNQPSRNPRSTVGTSTEIYDYIRLLYARIGTSICHKCGKIVQKDTPQYAAEQVFACDESDKVYILFAPQSSKPQAAEVEQIFTAGFFRIFDITTNNILNIENSDYTNKDFGETVFFLADRLAIKKDSDTLSRMTDSIESAFLHGNGRIAVWNQSKSELTRYSNLFECADCDILYEEPEPRLFSFNNPKGACPHCQGFGRTMGIDEDLVIPDKNLPLKLDAIVPLKSNSFIAQRKIIFNMLEKNNIDYGKPYRLFTESEKNILWNGDNDIGGINGFFKWLEENSYKIQNRIIISRFRGFTKCYYCGGSRLRRSARQVFVSSKNIPELVQFPLDVLLNFFRSLQLSDYQKKVAEQLIREIDTRLEMLVDIGLEYLTLSRLTHTLSGGESQRINLATALGSSLVGTLYVLDEPSIGMHPRDTSRLLNILLKLRNLGNTIVVVEHDPDIIKFADFIIDMGPKAGSFGGELVFAGNFAELLKSKKSLTADYLTGRKKIAIPTTTRKPTNKQVRINDITHNNLNIDEAVFPLNMLVAVTGVSGSGKSSLVHNVLYAGIKKMSGSTSVETGSFSKITGYHDISFIELVDQSSIGLSSRSTPATYTKVFDHIRDVFSQTQAAKQLGLRPGYFSFNVSGGRCEVCEGDGYVTVDMQFLPDVRLICEDCDGTRYKKEARSIYFNGKSIVDVLDMTVDDAAVFFAEEKKIINKLSILQNVGLGYLKLGQPSTMLSGGETQRVKLATHLDSSYSQDTLFIFDEPTTGLHLDDISKLLNAIQSLIDKGHSAVIIEHNINFIAAADWIIDLGPEAGSNGGKIIAEGPPEKIMKNKNSYTAKALREFYGQSD